MTDGDTLIEQPQRDSRGRWLKGGPSPCPGGKHPGEPNLMVELRRQLSQQAPDGRTKAARLAEILVDEALGGDLRAALLVLERFAPREKAVRDALAEVDTGAPLVVVTGIAAGVGELAQQPALRATLPRCSSDPATVEPVQSEAPAPTKPGDPPAEPSEAQPDTFQVLRSRPPRQTRALM